MLLDRGPRLRGYSGGRRRGMGDESITVTDTAVPVEYVPVDISTPSELTYSGGNDSSTLDLSNYFDWISGATPAPAGPVFFPSQGGAKTANALASLATQVASLFRPTAAGAAAGGGQSATTARPAAGASSWLQANMGLVVAGGIGLVVVLALAKGGRR